MKVRLSAYERVINVLNTIPPGIDRLVCEALESLRRERAEARAERELAEARRFERDMPQRKLRRVDPQPGDLALCMGCHEEVIPSEYKLCPRCLSAATVRDEERIMQLESALEDAEQTVETTVSCHGSEIQCTSFVQPQWATFKVRPPWQDLAEYVFARQTTKLGANNIHTIRSQEARHIARDAIRLAKLFYEEVERAE